MGATEKNANLYAAMIQTYSVGSNKNRYESGPMVIGGMKKSCSYKSDLTTRSSRI